jgi:hypothetical protein
LFTDPNLASLAVCRAVNLSLEHGNSDGSCSAYVWLGMIAGPHFGNYKAGFRFGRLGYELVEKPGLNRFQASTYMCFGNFVIPWTKHVRSGRDLVLRAFEAANKTGDLCFAAYSCNNLNTNLLAAGDPLLEVQREAEKGLAFAKKVRFGFVIDLISVQVALVRTLRGLTPIFGSLNDEEFDETQYERHHCARPILTRLAVEILQQYDWPGNIRELRNVIERAVILAQGGPIAFDVPVNGASIDLAALKQTSNEREEAKFINEAEIRRRECENIFVVLQKTGWKIKGADGAARLLGVKPTTLISRIKRMGLVRPV